MKKIQCLSPGCETKRRHYEDDSPRGPQFVTVEDDYNGPVYCSLECAMYAGKLKKKDESLN